VSRKNRRKPISIENIEILNTASKGKSVAKHNGRVIFVKGGVPGDICDITVFKRRKKFWEAKIEKIIKKSRYRIKPKCTHFGTCGGCKWQNMNYEAQLEFKQNQVLDNFSKIGGVTIEKFNDILGSDKIYNYRNKMEFTFSNKRWLKEDEIKNDENIIDKNALGFHVPGMFDKVIDLKKCFLQENPSNKIRNSVKEFALENNLSFFDIRNQKGFLRNLMIRNTNIGELMVLVQFYYEDKKKIDLLMNFIKKSFKEITSLLYTVNEKANNTIYDQKIICFYGRKYITEKIGDLSFKIGPKSFFQTNSDQAEVLYKSAKKLADITKNDTVYDLYTGTGTIAQFIASNAKKVIGIDSVPEAIEAANLSAIDNNISNCMFFAGDMKNMFSDNFIQKNGKPDIIITDPPRDGMHKKVIEQLLKIMCRRIVYISCNPATQARDIALLKEKYEISNMQTVDMFPHTHHVENILVLDLK
tara:strand:- start:1616 stop:3028 length:1413 start_codon:yes stop_codon:yes gene_type:complete